MTDLAGSTPHASPLVVRSVPIDDPGSLLSLLPRDGSLAWVHHTDGIVGWGHATAITASGASRFADADAWWRDLATRAVVRDEVRVPGSGLVAFGSFAFSDSPGDSTLVVPSVIVGRRGDAHWVTTISSGSLATPPGLRTHTAARPADVVFADGAMSGAEWELVIADAVRRIQAGDLDKVVLARDLVAETPTPLDVRWPLQRLADRYAACWTFHVDGLFGATPEMLVRRERGLVTSRVLAGTIRRTGDDAHDLALAASLARSSKDLEEHEYAVRSVAESLAPHCSSMNVPESPFVLHLPNVMHLATDVAGVIDDSTSSLGLAAALHPSAAVGGTPTATAVDLIAQIEGMDRGRYAGPVGWIDGNGDGEWGIALRSASVDGERVRLYAGCGIVADSDPEAELAESQAKLIPVRDALGG
ncbi:isochorismate synthase [Solicola gregarius]|uniref:isochorismate synthase n=1 Tax=Solicola gregarius TaxID=2908642 RepID=A0AA46TE63_9ACTN|nr:isochorismate synthase [Solicola gregarius]UYM03676.1 chorismate-binding protein [Solicola gregarius]